MKSAWGLPLNLVECALDEFPDVAGLHFDEAGVAEGGNQILVSVSAKRHRLNRWAGITDVYPMYL
jgi:hypothetical protein